MKSKPDWRDEAAQETHFSREKIHHRAHLKPVRRDDPDSDPDPRHRRTTHRTMKLPISALLATLALCLQAFGSTVTGTIDDIIGDASTNTVTFYPKSTPFFIGDTLVKSGQKTIYSDIHGDWSTTLHAGDYAVVYNGRDRMAIAVPDDDLTYTVRQLTVTATTYVYRMPPASATTLGSMGDIRGMEEAVAGQAMVLREDGYWGPGDVTYSGNVGNMMSSTYDPDTNGVFALAQGGTGGTTAAAARANIGAGASQLVAGQKYGFVFQGDSITEHAATSWPVQLVTQLTNYVGFYQNSASSSDTAQNMWSTYSTEIHPYAPSVTGSNAWLFLWAGANDIGTRTAAQLYGDISNICTSAKADGFRVALFDIGARVGGDAVRTTVNKAVDDSKAVLCDIFYKVSDRMKNPGDLQGVYADNTHPNLWFKRAIAEDLVRFMQGNDKVVGSIQPGLLISTNAPQIKIASGTNTVPAELLLVGYRSYDYLDYNDGMSLTLDPTLDNDFYFRDTKYGTYSMYFDRSALSVGIGNIYPSVTNGGLHVARNLQVNTNIHAGGFISAQRFYGALSWTNLIDVPAGFADGTDDGAGGGSGDFLADGSVAATGDFNMGGHSITNIDNFNVGTVNADTLNLGTPLDGYRVSFSDPGANYASNTVGGVIVELESVNGSGPNASDGKVDWTQLKGIPTSLLTGSQMTNAYTTVINNSTALTARTNLHVTGSGIVATDNAGANRTDLSLDDDLEDLVDGSLTGGKVGAGISPSNLTGSGTVPTNGMDPLVVLAQGGYIGGTGQAPTVTGIRETAGPTLLTIGSIADGQALVRSGSSVVGATQGASADYAGETTSAASVNLYTNSPATNTTFQLAAKVVAGGETNRATWHKSVGGYRAGSAPTLFTSDTPYFGSTSTTELNTTNLIWVVSGNTVVLQAWGVNNGAEDVHWQASDVQITSTTNMLAAAGGGTCSTPYESNTGTTNGTTALGSTSAFVYVSQRFTATSTHDICAITNRMWRIGSPTFTATCSIYSEDGAENDPLTLVGTASSSVSAAGIGTSPQDVIWPDMNVTVTSGTAYHIVWIASGFADTSNCLQFERTGGTLTGSIHNDSDGSGTWTLTSGTRILKYAITGP